MRELGKIMIDEKGRIYLEIASDQVLMSNDLLFYLIIEMRRYQKGESVPEFKEGYELVEKVLLEGKMKNSQLRQEIGIEDNDPADSKNFK